MHPNTVLKTIRHGSKILAILVSYFRVFTVRIAEAEMMENDCLGHATLPIELKDRGRETSW